MSLSWTAFVVAMRGCAFPRRLGLYEISASLKAYQLVPRVLHAMALCGLYVAIGALASKQWLHARAKEQVRCDGV